MMSFPRTLEWYNKLLLEIKGAYAFVDEVNNVVIGNIAIKKLPFVISTRLLFSLSTNRFKREKSISYT